MYLDKEEESMLSGEKGEALRLAMEIILKLGEFYNAERTIKITSSQISGVSYKNIGDAGIDLLRKFKNVKVSVKTFLNPIGFELDFPYDFTHDENFISKQMEIVKIFNDLGVYESLTCTPYYYYSPSFGEHIAWAESSAIVYANSVLGARTNRESGISALASSLTGRTSYYGMHLEENRKATILVETDFKPDYFTSTVLGLYLGKNFNGKIPYFKTVENDLDTLKQLGAAMNASGSIPMFHVENITPEYKNGLNTDHEKIHIEFSEIEEFREKINSNIEPEVLMAGCPHLSSNEIRKIATFVKNKKVKNGKSVYFFTSRKIKNENQELVKIIENTGAKIYTDTCMVVSPLKDKFNTLYLSSGKSSYYIGKEKKIVLSDLFGILEVMMT
ncbi:MAG: aconitase X catalytic domain-containing protein [Thermoplasmata archaeon]